MVIFLVIDRLEARISHFKHLKDNAYTNLLKFVTLFCFAEFSMIIEAVGTPPTESNGTMVGKIL